MPGSLSWSILAEEPVAIQQAVIGSWAGDTAELAGVPRLISLVATTECRLLHLPSNAVQILLAEHPEHWRSFYRLSARNMRAAISLLSEALSLTLRARVSRRLLQLASVSGQASITQEELAKLVGVTRVTMRRCLDDLAARGAIEMQYRKLRVLNASVLQAFRDEQ